MNYYDDLGVAPNASPEEIKEAYRTLVRLLHPDHHPEPELQRVADLQVKKLNRVYGVLSDVERRRRYDQELAEAAERATPIIIHAPPVHARTSAVQRNSLAWVSAVGLFAFLLIWMLSRDTPSVPVYRESGASIAAPAGTGVNGGGIGGAAGGESTLSRPDAAPAPLERLSRASEAVKSAKVPSDAFKEEADRLRLRLTQVLGERDAALAEVAKLQARASLDRLPRSLPASGTERTKVEPKRQLLPAEPVPEIRRPAEPVIALAKTYPPPIADPPALPRNSLAGNWSYRKPNTPPKDKDLYPPEFIETTITEENGQLRGVYRARYHVLDRPVSPDVNFQFAGRSMGEGGILAWNGAGGARGEVTFRLMADHSLRVDWVASQLGSLGFYKGTAVLFRKD